MCSDTKGQQDERPGVEASDVFRRLMKLDVKDTDLFFCDVSGLYQPCQRGRTESG